MNKNEFTELFSILCEDTLGENRNSTTDIDDAYDTFIDLTKQLQKRDESLIMMERMSEMNKRERLRWRMVLAETGIEMTPNQVDEYIILLDLAIATSNE